MIVHKSLQLGAITFLLAACGSTPKPVAPIERIDPVAGNVKPEDAPTRGNIVIATDIRKACGLSDVDAYFAFDSDHVRSEDKRVLRTLADCFTSGPLKGHQMSLIGHADPRGSEDYNLALGGRRADNVKFIIVAENMNANSISTTSRGKMDATGTDEASWAKDRTVDVELID